MQPVVHGVGSCQILYVYYYQPLLFLPHPTTTYHMRQLTLIMETSLGKVFSVCSLALLWRFWKLTRSHEYPSFNACMTLPTLPYLDTH